MNMSDIKVGETYYVRVQVDCFHRNKTVVVVQDEDGDLAYFLPQYFYPCPTAQDTPKYDPFRLFRKGDKAKPRIINGREIPKMPLDVIFTVTGDEDEYGAVPVEYMSPVRGLLTSTTVHAVWLELVTPVEEKERYVLIHNKLEKYYDVCWKDDDEPDGRTGRTRVRNTYWYHNPPMTYTQQEAKAAAEAECARMNAEWRKEQGND